MMMVLKVILELPLANTHVVNSVANPSDARYNEVQRDNEFELKATFGIGVGLFAQTLDFSVRQCSRLMHGVARRFALHGRT